MQEMRLQSNLFASELETVQCFASGAFNLLMKTSDPKRYIMQMYSTQGGEGMVYYSLSKDELNEPYTIDKAFMINPWTHVCLQKYSEDGKIKYYGRLTSRISGYKQVGFSDIELMANGWFVLSFKDGKILCDTIDTVHAKQFKQAQTFLNDMYALSDDDPPTELQTNKTSSWKLFDCDDKLLTVYENVLEFVGNGNALVQKGKDVFLLSPYGLEQKVSYCQLKKFTNGRFVLIDENGYKMMYSAEGVPMSQQISQAFYLPDGKFVQQDENHIWYLYNDIGIREKFDLVGYEIVANYYFLYDSADVSFLYDEDGNLVDTGYNLLAHTDDFFVVEKDGCYYLYNRTGQVLEL